MRIQAFLTAAAINLKRLAALLGCLRPAVVDPVARRSGLSLQPIA
jgi:hypothetical protein